jgi:hypothetical protein
MQDLWFDTPSIECCEIWIDKIANPKIPITTCTMVDLGNGKLT